MLFRSLAAAAALLVASTPVGARELDLRAQVAAFVQPSNEARTAVAVAQLRAAGFEPTIETFTGGNARTGAMEGRNVVVTIGDGPREPDAELMSFFSVCHISAGFLILNTAICR